MKEGPFRATYLLRFAYDSATHLPAEEEIAVELGPELAALASPSPPYRFVYEEVLPNRPVSPNAFAFRSPEGFSFVDPKELRAPVSHLVGQFSDRWNLESLDGHAISFSGQKRATLLVTTAAWCLACNRALKALSGLAQESEIEDVQVVIVSLDRDRSMVTRYLKELPSGMVLAHEPTFHDRLGLSGVPTILVVAPDGRVSWVQTGWGDNVLDRVRQALRECRKPTSRSPQDRP